MKITVEWLKEFVETDASAAEIGDELTMLGLELEAAEESPLGPVLDFKVTPNRGDCLSVFGLARELAAKDAQRYRPTELFRRAATGFGDPPASVAPGREGSLVTVEAPELCPRYVAQVIRGVRLGASSGKISARLTACGMRPIDSIVDTTNYVMLELGQPLHAFDLRQLHGGRIVVRTARSGEVMKSLDGQERKLTPEMLMICDAERPVAIAGVMGGENSEVAADTTEILLESAHFDPVSIRSTRKTLGMSTEASYRFERFVDPELCLAACRRVCELLGVAGDAEFDAYPGRDARKAIVVREARWNRLLGMEVPVAAAAGLLVGLGCKVSEVTGGLSAVPPSWRADVTMEEDLVEEIGRLWGYEKIPEALPHGSPMGGLGVEAAFRKRLKSAMLRLGFAETLTHSLCDESPLDPAGVAVHLRNPAAPELGLLRRSMLPGIAEAAAKNRGRPLALFEVGRVFDVGRERRSLGIIVSGDVEAAHWAGGKPHSHDFYSLKGVVEGVFALVGRPLEIAASADNRYHPGRCASILSGGNHLGVMGEISPAIAEKLDLPRGSLGAEIDVDSLISSDEAVPVYQRLSPYPPVRRDFAFVIPVTVGYAEVHAAIDAASEGLAERIWLFDVYAGKGIVAGHHSMGVAAVLRHPERTLTDEEANAFSERAFQSIAALGGVRR
ncbi:MAG: phenylalanine--tRNA ligase subunit beta [Armatimonadota bacterium]|nr:phenylalanine--tRNA ligase subunit beta [Armatimonadota bacterium]